MANSLPSDFKVYDDLAQTNYMERIQENIDLFNAQSNGAIVLRSESIVGDESKRAFYNDTGDVSHRDVTSNSAVSTTAITGDEHVTVKTPWKYGPYSITEESYKRRGVDPSLFYSQMGQAAADHTKEYFVTAALASLGAAINAGGMTATGSIADKKGLINGLRKFGDRFNRVALWVMSSDVFFDVVQGAITDKIYEEAGMVVYGGQPGTLGKPVLVSDEVDDSPNYVYALQRGAIQIVESQPPGFRSYEDNSTENLALAYRAEGAFNVDALGYSWTGTANPNLAALGTQGNWAQDAASDKNTAGVQITLT